MEVLQRSAMRSQAPPVRGRRVALLSTPLGERSPLHQLHDEEAACPARSQARRPRRRCRWETAAAVARLAGAAAWRPPARPVSAFLIATPGPSPRSGRGNDTHCRRPPAGARSETGGRPRRGRRGFQRRRSCRTKTCSEDRGRRRRGALLAFSGGGWWWAAGSTAKPWERVVRAAGGPGLFELQLDRGPPSAMSTRSLRPLQEGRPLFFLSDR